MSIATAEPHDVPAATERRVIHPLWVRVTHWINALAMLLMIGSGWQIYDASPLPLFRFEFPTSITLGGDLPTGLAWHFAAQHSGISRIYNRVAHPEWHNAPAGTYTAVATLASENFPVEERAQFIVR